ncbi:LysR family transcriptional regulator [Uliginosibacterium sediminicola]|uniref:LysR family transcriptional regulator n=1 Tax=Uliginosibacterium sediminicola TaxID=2024550 RepID=A0ABU9YTM9_9RHOO
MQKYDFLALKSFVQVVESGGFGKAAELLDASTAAISRRVSGLEQELGIQLFRRTTRRLDLTEAGQQFYRDVLDIFQMLEEAEERVRANRANVSGQMRIAAPMSFGVQRLTPLLPGFLQRYPELKIQLLLEDRATDLVAEGIDLAVRIGTLSDSSLIARRIADVPRRFCAAPAYLERMGVPLAPEELSRHQCLQYSPRGAREDWATVFGLAADALPISGPFAANNAEALLQCAIQGLGIILLPDFIVDAALADGRLREVLQPWAPPPFGLHVVRPSSRTVPTRIRLFIDYLIETLGAAPSQPE